MPRCIGCPSQQERGLDLVAVDDALSDLTRMDERQGRIVELRFFGGLANEEVAATLGILISTVKRDWSVAKVCLTRQLRGRAYDGGAAVAESLGVVADAIAIEYSRRSKVT